MVPFTAVTLIPNQHAITDGCAVFAETMMLLKRLSFGK